ncbi:MAG: hypothetical protein JNL82_35675 [Myxococcales bacterium]|nr:hypothetical protein [Myxococcales bacterium]
MIAALRRVLAAPWLVLALAATHLAVAAAVAAPVRLVVGASMGPYFHDEPRRLLAPLFELLSLQRGAGAAVVAAVAAAAALAALLGPLLAGAAIQRLGGLDRSARPTALEVVRAAVRFYPSALVIAIYGLVLRVVLLLVASALGSIHPTVQLGLSVLVLAHATASVDLARSRVVLAGARPFHPRTLLRAAATVAQEPRLLFGSAALSLLALAVSAAIVLVSVHGLATAWAPWAARGLAVLGTFVAVWRLAVAVQYAGDREPP